MTAWYQNLPLWVTAVPLLGALGLLFVPKETRRFFVTIPLRLGLTLLLMVAAIMTAFAIVMTGPIAEQFTKVTGVTADAIGG